MPRRFCTPLDGAGPLAIFGAGGHGREIAWLARECFGEGTALTFVVDHQESVEKSINGIGVMQLEDFAHRHPGSQVVVAIGDPLSRERSAAKCRAAGLRFVSLLHPRVEVSPWISLGEGCVVCAGSVLTANLVLGLHVHVNVMCSVSHDVNIGDFSTLSPGVHIAGWVTMGQRVFIGTGASIKNGSRDRPIVIGDDAIIGAGACVIGDVEPETTVAGVPARTT